MVCGGHAVAVGAGGASLFPALPSPARVIGGCEATLGTLVRGWRSSCDGENPFHPASPVLLRALCPEAAAHEKSSLFRELFAFCGRKSTARKAHIVRREGRGKCRAEKEKPCSSALSPCRCLETSLALRLTHLRLGSDSSPHDGGRDLPERPEETFSGEGGGRRRKVPFFQKGLLPPRHTRPGDDSRTGKTSRPVPDRWRSARPFR